MTIAVALKVGDGIVLGADSAATVSNIHGEANVYFNAEKAFNLAYGIPIGAVTYGLFGFRGRSTTRVMKDLREEFSKKGSALYVDPHAYTVQNVAERLRDHFYGNLFLTEYPEGEDRPAFGFIVAGYSAGAERGEVWKFDVLPDGTCREPWEVIAQPRIGAIWDGQTESLDRLVRGWAPQLGNALLSQGYTPEQVAVALDNTAPLWHNAMPIQDAIDLVRYLIEVTVGFVRFMPGHPTVAAPIDLATITPHEGFRWVARKHYYPMDRNPPFPVTIDPSPKRPP